MLAPERIDAYERDGYLLVEDALSPRQLETLRRVTHELIERSRKIEASDDVYDLAEGHRAESPRLNRIKLPHLRDPAYWEVVRSERIASILRALLGPDGALQTKDYRAECLGCHAPAGHTDWVYVEGYPLLR